MEAKFSLTWHSYSDHLKGMMKEIMASGDFADVTLICDGKEQIKAHKNILAACSPVLKDILQIENSSVIYLKGINFSEMESIIEYIYLGETTAYQEQMNGFLDVAKNLEIKGLTNEDDVPRKEEDLGRKSTEEDLIIENETKEFNNEGGILEENCDDDFIIKKEHLTSRTQEEILNKTPKQNKSTIKDDRDRQYICIECNKTYRDASGLYHHNQTIHEGITFECFNCDYKASKKSHLKRHTEKRHPYAPKCPEE